LEKVPKNFSRLKNLRVTLVKPESGDTRYCNAVFGETLCVCQHLHFYKTRDWNKRVPK